MNDGLCRKKSRWWWRLWQRLWLWLCHIHISHHNTSLTSHHITPRDFTYSLSASYQQLTLTTPPITLSTTHSINPLSPPISHHYSRRWSLWKTETVYNSLQNGQSTSIQPPEKRTIFIQKPPLLDGIPRIISRLPRKKKCESARWNFRWCRCVQQIILSSLSRILPSWNRWASDQPIVI